MSWTGARLIVTGKVQGVFFRKSTAKRALELGVIGHVRNLPTGQVAVDVQGEEKAVEALITFCHRGPEMARVDDVTIDRYTIDSASYETFSVRYS